MRKCAGALATPATVAAERTCERNTLATLVAAGLREHFVATTDDGDTLSGKELAPLLEARGVRVKKQGGMAAAAKAEVVKFLKERNGPNPMPPVSAHGDSLFRYVKLKAQPYKTPQGKGRAAPVEGRDDDDEMWLELMGLLDAERV